MSFITIFIYNLFSLYAHSTLSGVSEPNENPYPTHYMVCPAEERENHYDMNTIFDAITIYFMNIKNTNVEEQSVWIFIFIPY